MSTADMPCHITAMGDEFGSIPTLLCEKLEEERLIAIIQGALYSGDKYKAYGVTTDFSNVIDDGLTCNPEFANALRALMNGEPRAVFKVRDVVREAALKVATDIYDDLEAV